MYFKPHPSFSYLLLQFWKLFSDQSVILSALNILFWLQIRFTKLYGDFGCGEETLIRQPCWLLYPRINFRHLVAQNLPGQDITIQDIITRYYYNAILASSASELCLPFCCSWRFSIECDSLMALVSPLRGERKLKPLCILSGVLPKASRILNLLVSLVSDQCTSASTIFHCLKPANISLESGTVLQNHSIYKCKAPKHVAQRNPLESPANSEDGTINTYGLWTLENMV